MRTARFGTAPIAGEEREKLAFVLLGSGNQARQIRNIYVLRPAGAAPRRRAASASSPASFLQSRQPTLGRWMAGIEDGKPSGLRNRMDNAAEGAKRGACPPRPSRPRREKRAFRTATAAMLGQRGLHAGQCAFDALRGVFRAGEIAAQQPYRRARQDAIIAAGDQRIANIRRQQALRA